MADWAKIENEYITTEATQEELAKKYGVSQSTLNHKASKGSWSQKRLEIRSKVAQKVIKTTASRAVSRTKKFMDASDAAIDKLMSYIEQQEPETMSGTDMNAVANALKKLQEVQGIKSDADKREQEARIEALRQRSNPASGLEGQHYGIMVLPPVQPLKPPEDGDQDG